MGKSRIHGWQAVYRFSLKEHLKGMPFQVMTGLVCVLLLVSLPVVHWMVTALSEIPATQVKILYVADETGVGMDYSGFSEQEDYRQVEVRQVDDAEAMIETLQTEDAEEGAVLARIQYTGERIQLDLYYGGKSGVGEVDLTRLGDALLRYYRQNAAMGAAQADQADILSRNVETQVVKLKNQTIPEMTARLSTIEYGMIMVISCLAMMFVAISGEGIASSIVTEKSSKITEYLLTSVRPLALIVGKVLSVLTAVFLQFILMALSLAASWGLTRLLGGSGLSLSVILGGAVGDLRISPWGVVGAVLIFALGLILYGMMAGVIGASVSRVEETSEGLKLYNIVLIGCSLFGVLAARLGADGDFQILVILAVLCPFSSPFIVPAYLALGKLSVWLLVPSVLLLLLTLILTAYLVAGVYEALIFYRGSHLKWKQIVKIALNRKEA